MSIIYFLLATCGYPKSEWLNSRYNITTSTCRETRIYLDGFLEQIVISRTLLYDLHDVHDQFFTKDTSKKCKD